MGGEEGWEEGGEMGRYQELEGTVSSEKVYLANLEAYKVYRFNIQKEVIRGEKGKGREGRGGERLFGLF